MVNGFGISEKIQKVYRLPHFMQSRAGVHTCTSYVAKKVLWYKMIHVSLLTQRRRLCLKRSGKTLPTQLRYDSVTQSLPCGYDLSPMKRMKRTFKSQFLEFFYSKVIQSLLAS